MSINISLIGRKYYDYIIHVDNFVLGETNQIVKTERRLGGMFNIENIDGVNPTYCPMGEKHATIISEHSRRSSIVEDSDGSFSPFVNLDFFSGDWFHLIYVDDLNADISNTEKDMSLDFCTTKDRSLYYEKIKSSTLVFDSRERKELYNNILTETPIILHDKNGCECIISGRVAYKASNKEIRDLRVNGAGDIFSAIFIRDYWEHGLKYAVKWSSKKTTQELVSRNEKV